MRKCLCPLPDGVSSGVLHYVNPGCPLRMVCSCVADAQDALSLLTLADDSDALHGVRLCRPPSGDDGRRDDDPQAGDTVKTLDLEDCDLNSGHLEASEK